jgi:hypothetical protein
MKMAFVKKTKHPALIIIKTWLVYERNEYSWRQRDKI